MEEMQQIWNFLDDMAENNPEAYKEFMHQQLVENRPFEEIEPSPGFVFKTKTKGGQKFFVNVCSHDKIKPPEPMKQKPEGMGDDEVALRYPISTGDLREEKDKAGASSLACDVVVNPITIKMANEEPDKKAFIVELAIRCIEERHKEELERGGAIKFPRLRYKGDKVRKQQIRKEGPPVEVPRPPEIVATETQARADQNQRFGVKPSFILSEAEVKKGAPKKAKGTEGAATPRFIMDIEREGTRPARLCFRIELPGLDTAEGVEVDVSASTLELATTSQCPAQYLLSVDLPMDVDDTASAAVFFRRQHALCVTLPVKAAA